jgi:hypothetical protein
LGGWRVFKSSPRRQEFRIRESARISVFFAILDNGAAWPTAQCGGHVRRFSRRYLHPTFTVYVASPCARAESPGADPTADSDLPTTQSAHPRHTLAAVAFGNTMRQRLSRSLPYILLYSLLAGYVLALVNGVGARDPSDSQPVAIGEGEIRLGHGPLDEGGRPIDHTLTSDDDTEAPS